MFVLLFRFVFSFTHYPKFCAKLRYFTQITLFYAKDYYFFTSLAYGLFVRAI
jgi:hypothetical protein